MAKKGFVAEVTFKTKMVLKGALDKTNENIVYFNEP